MGSCSNKGIINLPWRLMMTTLFAIDGVIVHELVHLKHFDHSKDFHAVLREYLPDYDERYAELNRCLYTMRCEGWMEPLKPKSTGKP